MFLQRKSRSRAAIALLPSLLPRPRLALPTTSHQLDQARLVLALFALSFASNAFAQRLDPIAEWATNTSYGTVIHQNLVYQRAGSVDLRLDVITAASGPTGRPVVIYFHGGGWVEGDKEGVLLKTLPYLAWGMDVVNVEYRLASQALAPAAVEDGRCALRWVAQHAKEYGFDAAEIVVAGESAGGHLALMTGILTPEAGFDDACEVPPDDWQQDGPKNIRVAAIINFFGPVDLPEFLQPSNTKANTGVLPMPRNFVLRWFGDQPNRMELAKRLSPLTYVRKDSPPILTVHGDKDPYVPYQQAVLLRDALDRSGVQNRLVTIQGGGHGASPPFAWSPEQNLLAHEAVFRFLKKAGVLLPR
jgi:acetyl esterase/lipase